MLKKIYFSLALLLFIFLPNISQAWSATEILARYNGSVLLADSGFARQYWYLEPSTQERYALDSRNQLDHLINKFAQDIKAKDLAKLATYDNKQGADYNLAKKYQGKFLHLKEKDKDEIWYINPLDLSRYLIENNDSGLASIQNLALDIADDKLNALPLAELEEFNVLADKISFDNYWKIYQTLKKDYYKTDKIDDTKLFYGSLKGLVEAVGDPYTEFFTPQAKKDFDDNLSGSTEGIGAVVDIKDGELTIITPLDDLPADQAGLLPHDQILMVNDQSIKGLSLNESVNLIKGPAGTTVKLQIYRPSTNRRFEVNITRTKIVVPNVTGKRLDNNLSYIKINNFGAHLAPDFATTFKQFVDDGTRGLIIDLRNNPGGYTDSAIYLADQWLDSGQIIFQEKFPKLLMSYRASSPVEIKLPTVILVNNGSASAAEIFTAALKQHAKAKIVGSQTFGKGTGQTIQLLDDGSAVKYTIFEWLDPLGQSIEKVGVTPDVDVATTPNNGFDNQLYQAIQVLSK